ncbi:MAG: D-tyrosyl-tRNA(Tyr) deacylase [Candidatus Aminicenantes bacterium]|nr:D-tyrosyl-tRNA(Tyr) deacylase [Candidatus Aminicenantes bacterium]NIM84641.1 D-tyrosyl-tRNA(Tyr) deacylase [Candidatus Aminicenantes bacterium]NIN24146.1 D-tyrosyl-tRNA(Tyr) deacylase [Candidatus Aminicenantes bacterium]NIN47870.1 D-tyrosyl-tRNA(Tyr) deacylase [Candidatus Aminicenantes bacterium]NIN90808.1 D-tyrosyl-tRNA(Tyr) deacylase [Candidatus Aminicenantes bacterium]
MRTVIQRVSRASVEVDGKVVGKINRGILAFVGIEKGDTDKEIAFMAEKILNLRIFPDDEYRMNLSVKDIGGEILSISQFTLASHIKKGRRPDFTNAEEPGRAEELYETFNELLSHEIKVEKGVFGAMMQIESINDGPVTFIIEKKYNKQ